MQPSSQSVIEDDDCLRDNRVVAVAANLGSLSIHAVLLLVFLLDDLIFLLDRLVVLFDLLELALLKNNLAVLAVLAGGSARLHLLGGSLSGLLIIAVGRAVGGSGDSDVPLSAAILLGDLAGLQLEAVGADDGIDGAGTAWLISLLFCLN